MNSNNCNDEKSSRPAPRSILSQIAMVSEAIGMGGDRAQHATELELMFAGLKKYQQSSFRRSDNPDLFVCHAIGPTNLLFFHSLNQAAVLGSVFIVPSIVNGYEILDILPEKSFINYLREQGYDVYVVDWGELKQNKDVQSVGALYSDVLIPMLKKAYECNDNQPLSVMGYCMGGTLLVPLLQHYPEYISRCVFLASPWDFHSGVQSLTDEIESQRDMLSGYLMQADYLPMDWLQVLFAKVDPLSFKNKFSRFAKMDQNGFDAKIFICVEDWLNDGHDLPSYVARMTLQEWYHMNYPCQEKWKVMGEVVDAAFVDVPCLVFVAENDRLVPPVSSKKLSAQIPNCEFVQASCGHVGLMVGRGCEEKVWSPIVAWLSS